MKPDKLSIWKEVLDSVRVSVSPAIYSTWLSQTHLVSLRKVDDTRYLAEIGCNSAFVKTTIEKRYFGLLQDILIKTIQNPTDLTFSVKQSAVMAQQTANMSPLFEDRNNGEDIMQKIALARLRPGFTFENFAVSASNQMAYAAAEAIAQQPGYAYNPLFIWGGVGVGKTHLMHAVGHTIIKTNPSAKIIVCTGEEFTNDIVEGIRNKTTQQFRDKYRKLNALFIDDIQFIAGKETVQEEFFHTFNAVTTAGGQVILTSDRPPTEISKLEERLRSRFEAGLIVDITAPDFELRCAIVQLKAPERGLELPVEIVHMIAANLDTARKIEGFLIRLTSEVKLKNAVLDEHLVETLFGKGITGDDATINISPEKMIDAVCTHYNVSRRALTGKARARLIARPRQVLMYLLRTELKLPLDEVGKLLGGRDHTTVMHGVDKITQLATSNVYIREDIMQIKSIL